MVLASRQPLFSEAINTMPFESIKEIYKKMSHAAMRAGRDPHDVRLVAVTKEVDVETMIRAVESGLRDLGESRIQAAREKIPAVTERKKRSRITWHLIGHLQTNKARAAVELFDLIHSVDSLDLAVQLDRHAGTMGKKQRILLQVKLSEEESKYGISKDNILAAIREVSLLGNLSLKGLMTIPPYMEDPEQVRPYFRQLREIRDEAVRSGCELPELSMGMSHDFWVAIEEGATLVRIGTAIFGERRIVK
jgi:pyridoxal phosphate enzyme (YggS family)